MKKLLFILVIFLISCSRDDEGGCKCVMVNKVLGDVKGNYICKGIPVSNVTNGEYLLALGMCADMGEDE